MDEDYSIVDHPMLLIISAVYHLERKGGIPTFGAIYDELYPLISKDDLRKELKFLVSWGAIHEGVKNVAKKAMIPDFVRTYETGSYSGSAARDTYEHYWEQIIMAKLIREENEEQEES